MVFTFNQYLSPLESVTQLRTDIFHFSIIDFNTRGVKRYDYAELSYIFLLSNFKGLQTSEFFNETVKDLY